MPRAALARVLLCLLLLPGCQTGPSLHARTDGAVPHGSMKPTKVIEPGALPDLAAILPRLAGKRVIFIGERHTALSDHLNQLAIIRGLYEQGKELAIGAEFFQQPFQNCLDDFIAGRLDETGLLSCTEYYERWRYDWRLYRDIAHFARERGIPLVALNIESEIVQKVSEKGWEGLSAADSAKLPQSVDRSNQRYEARLRQIFRAHPRKHPGLLRCGEGDADATEDEAAFRRFVDVQLLWDESMAEKAAGYLAEHPGRTLVVLAGSGHLAYGEGIPDRVIRRMPTETAPMEMAIILPIQAMADDGADDGMDIADFLLASEPRTLPPPGRLGIMLEMGAEGVRAASFAPKSAAEAAGMEKDDRIVEIDEHPIETMADVKLALWDKRPGDVVPVNIRRSGGGAGRDARIRVELR